MKISFLVGSRCLVFGRKYIELPRNMSIMQRIEIEIDEDENITVNGDRIDDR